MFLLLKLEEPKRCIRELIGILFKAIVGNALGAVSAFISQRKSKAFYNALHTTRKQQKFQVNRLDYVEEAMTLYVTYSASDIVYSVCH